MSGVRSSILEISRAVVNCRWNIPGQSPGGSRSIPGCSFGVRLSYGKRGSRKGNEWVVKTTIHDTGAGFQREAGCDCRGVGFDSQGATWGGGGIEFKRKGKEVEEDDVDGEFLKIARDWVPGEDRFDPTTENRPRDDA
ncbi:hypothetical protein C8F04DRAFT_1197516 [Mycena alexandri]|uniref:Uncharacterized protein n=1 Tax=Mycena alexandri TaxID=1745969 RepID=A0AAD6WSR0_9AGAR|nr:hypothetical protein C8F04DRAFT_1197516 [Mycena alexandri]